MFGSVKTKSVVSDQRTQPDKDEVKIRQVVFL